MPLAALRPCGPTCPTLTRGGRCDKHATAAWAPSLSTPERIRGRKLQKLREALFTREPFCRMCPPPKKFATIRDHIIPLAEGGTDTDDNVQPLCQACSDKKTAQESARGRHRARG